MLPLGAREEIARFRERRHEPIARAHHVPPDVIEVHVRTQDDVDRLARVAGLRERREEVRSAFGEVVEPGHRVPADAGVDQDPQVARVDHEAVNRQLELAVRREEVGLEPAAVRSERRGGRFGQEFAERQPNRELRDPRDLHIADLPGERRHSRVLRRGLRTSMIDL